MNYFILSVIKLFAGYFALGKLCKMLIFFLDQIIITVSSTCALLHISPRATEPPNANEFGSTTSPCHAAAKTNLNAARARAWHESWTRPKGRPQLISWSRALSFQSRHPTTEGAKLRSFSLDEKSALRLTIRSTLLTHRR